MEVKVERADAGEACESYTMLECEAIVRNHRKLRREVCVGRVVVSLLLLTCVAFCVVLYNQHESKNEEKTNEEMEMGSRTGVFNSVDVWTPRLTSLSISTVPESARANLTWKPYHILLNDFHLNEANETDALVIPRDGKYKLHLQLTYASPTDTQISLSHRIVWYPSPGQPVTILRVFDTLVSNFKSVSSEVAYTFAKGQTVMVESDNANLISGDGDWSTKNLLIIQLVTELKV